MGEKDLVDFAELDKEGPKWEEDGGDACCRQVKEGDFPER